MTNGQPSGKEGRNVVVFVPSFVMQSSTSPPTPPSPEENKTVVPLAPNWAKRLQTVLA